MRHSVLAGAVLAAIGLNSPALMAHEGEDEGGHLIPHEVAGIDIDGGMTWYFQGTDGTNNDSADLTYTLDLNFSAPVGENGKAVVAFEAGNGQGVDGRLGSLSTANYDAFVTDVTASASGATDLNSPNISQLYYEGEYMDGTLTVDFGKLDVHSMTDDNAYANDETDQFLSGIFTRTAGSNFAELDRYYGPGLAGTYSADLFDVTAVIANGNSSGFDSIIDRPYGALQVNIKPIENGNYRFYVIQDGRRYTNINSGASTDNTAWGLSFDQELMDGFGVFARYSSQDDKVQENVVESAWSLGAALQGSLWGHDDDALGIGYGSINVNNNPAATTAAGLTNPDDETHWELYYKFGVSDHFTVTPDVQVISNNGGDATADTVTVYGVRAQVNM